MRACYERRWQNLPETCLIIAGEKTKRKERAQGMTFVEPKEEGIDLFYVLKRHADWRNYLFART
jgi:hypothetical protein